MSNLYGISAYRQTNSAWKTNGTGTEQRNKIDKSAGTENEAKLQSEAYEKASSDMKFTEWKPLRNNSLLIPRTDSQLGTVIGNVALSDEAKEYYDKLKAKYHNMDFILVSTDIKGQVAKNASAYGNANKPVVLIDTEKIEKMATDESFRKKYEGIIAMSMLQLSEAKNSLSSSGASLKNFGMSVDSNGKTSFFATLEKMNAYNKTLAEKQAEKKAAKAKEKKAVIRKEQEEKLEEKRAQKSASEKVSEDVENKEPTDEKEYIVIKADSMENLIKKVSRYAYDNSEKQVLTDVEKQVGQQFDSRF